MIDYAKWKDALAMTESLNNIHAWGDHGLACGRWQMHLAFVDEWWMDDFVVKELTTWDQLFEACLRAFFDALAPSAPSATQLAMWFHLHGNKGPGWDNAYADRFERFYGGT